MLRETGRFTQQIRTVSSVSFPTPYNDAVVVPAAHGAPIKMARMASRPTWFWTSLLSSIGMNAVLFVSAGCWFYSQTPVYLPGHERSMVVVPIYAMSEIPIRDTI